MGTFGDAFRRGLKPPIIVSVSQWADDNRILARKASSEPGRWRTDRAPYLREIMDVLSLHDPCKKVVIKKASQVGVSEAVINGIGHTIMYSPCPILVIYPVEALAKKMSRLRFDTMIDASPTLSELVASNKGRDAKNTALEKEFTGGTITFGGASSPNALSSVSARELVLDEVDRMPTDVASEGDPISLAAQRTAAFSRFKIVMLSTPTRGQTSIISQEFELSDKRKCLLPCQLCGHFQELVIENFKYEIGNQQADDAWFECIGCKGRILETHKPEMLAAHKWVPTQESPTVGFHISQFYMPMGWKSWRAIAWEHAKALKDRRKMIAFVNTALGLEWNDSVEKPDWSTIYERRETYKIGCVPRGVLFLTAGVDVQGDRLECQVVGWTRDKSSYTIDYKIFYGDTDKEPHIDGPWKDLKEYVSKNFYTEDGGNAFPIQYVGVDTGYRTSRVYAFIRGSNRQLLAVKGDDRIMTPIGRPSITEVDAKGRSFKKGIHLWPVGVDHLKTELYDRLQSRKDSDTGEYPSGYCHFPEFEQEFFKQLTAESKKLKTSRNGRKSHEWIKDYDRNEALDTWIYARAVACRFGLDRFSDADWTRLESDLISPISSTETKIQTADPNKPKIKIQRKEKSSYWN